MDYMDLAFRCPRKAVKLNHSLTHLLTYTVNICLYYAHKTREICRELLYSLDFKASGEHRSPLSKTVISKCSFIWN